ncbi:MAG: hypothetical protein ACSLFB_02305 [Acidimicrobiales bacterium]
MTNDPSSQEEEEFLQLLESPGVKKTLSRTISNKDKTFDDGREYPLERVDAVTLACLQALEKTR